MLALYKSPEEGDMAHFAHSCSKRSSIGWPMIWPFRSSRRGEEPVSFIAIPKFPPGRGAWAMSGAVRYTIQYGYTAVRYTIY